MFSQIYHFIPLVLIAVHDIKPCHGQNLQFSTGLTLSLIIYWAQSKYFVMVFHFKENHAYRETNYKKKKIGSF